eukprot:scaffold40621_cov46-Phaeocystis_antarctica.AAC.1
MMCTVAHSGSAHTRQLSSAVRGARRTRRRWGASGGPSARRCKPKPFLPSHTTQAVTGGTSVQRFSPRTRSVASSSAQPPEASSR